MNQRGISLVEALTVVGIISISTAVATPPFIKWKADAAVRGTASHLTTSLQLARTYALIHQEYVVIKFGDDQCHIFVDNGEGGGTWGDWQRNGDEKLLYSFENTPGVSLESNFSGNRFRFKGFGRNSPGTIVLNKASDNRIDIVVNVLGRLRTKYY